MGIPSTGSGLLEPEPMAVPPAATDGLLAGADDPATVGEDEPAAGVGVLAVFATPPIPAHAVAAASTNTAAALAPTMARRRGPRRGSVGVGVAKSRCDVTAVAC